MDARGCAIASGAGHNSGAESTAVEFFYLRTGPKVASRDGSDARQYAGERVAAECILDLRTLKGDAARYTRDMSKSEPASLKKHLVDAMSGHHAHVDFHSVVADFPTQLQGAKPDGSPHSPWQLLEHMRIAQWDILEFSRNPKHKSPKWPEGYWPKTDAPPDSDAWGQSVESFRRDAAEMDKLISDPDSDLFKPFEHGDGQTLLREALLVANHNSYHLGQLMLLKKSLETKK